MWDILAEGQLDRRSQTTSPGSDDLITLIDCHYSNLRGYSSSKTHAIHYKSSGSYDSWKCHCISLILTLSWAHPWIQNALVNGGYHMLVGFYVDHKPNPKLDRAPFVYICWEERDTYIPRQKALPSVTRMREEGSSVACHSRMYWFNYMALLIILWL